MNKFQDVYPTSYHDRPYLRVAENILASDTYKEDRTGTGTHSIFGPQFSVNLLYGFPLLTSKKVNLRKIAVELEWFITGRTDLRFLLERGVRIWSDWPLKRYNTFLAKKLRKPKITKEEFEEKILTDDAFSNYWGDLGPVYGRQWRNQNGIDQFTQAIDTLMSDPDSRRIIVDAWNPAEIHQMALPPCHMMFQLYSRKATYEEKDRFVEYNESMGNSVEPLERALELKMTQRSADWFLGVPYNTASYALLTHFIASEVNMIPMGLHMSFGDAHIYSNHVNQVNEMLSRSQRRSPGLFIRQSKEDSDGLLNYDLVGYDPHDFIAAPVAV